MYIPIDYIYRNGYIHICIYYNLQYWQFSLEIIVHTNLKLCLTAFTYHLSICICTYIHFIVLMDVKDVTWYSKMTFSHVLISYVCVNKWKCKYRLISNTYYFPINHFAYEAVILCNLIAGFIYLSVYVICMYRIILMNLNVTKPFTKKTFQWSFKIKSIWYVHIISNMI